MIRREFTGLLPGAINKFEELLSAAAELNPSVRKGYDSAAGKDSFFYWGAACRIHADDTGVLNAIAEDLGITVLSDGDFAYTNGLTIEDFQTFRVNGDLELTPEKEGM